MEDHGVPVGITIARKRQKDGLLSTSDAKPVEKHRKTPRSLQVFLEGATLYLSCLVLPTVIAYVSHCFETARGDDSGDDTQSWSVSSVAYNNAAYYLCSTVPSDSSLHYWVASNWSWCPTEETNSLADLLSPDAQASDFAVVTVMSLLLAMLRIALVQYFVPLEDTERVEALVRCKSLHLLSREYTDTLTPKLDERPLVSMTVPDSSLMLPSLGMPSGDSSVGLQLDDSEGNSPSRRLSEECTPQDLDVLQQVAAALERDDLESRRLHAAPRYATAIFRLLYCTVASIVALYYFSDATFWPWYVGGRGATADCWNLSGGLTMGMDSDFDHHNAVLRRYFLWQASYHWHSGAFHLLSTMILLLHPRHQQAAGRFLSVQTTTSAYIRSLFHHLVALAFIGMAFVFSSLRRLCAIGMFAFDFSSCFLHLLQICINAPNANPKTVVRIHRWLVLPSFCAARFGVWPALWWSIATESQTWLKQLEVTLFPGVALGMKLFMHSGMLLMMCLTVVYFRRLQNHPHLQRMHIESSYSSS